MILACYKALKRIEPRPAMFIGESSLKSINTYIQGYLHALIDSEVPIQVMHQGSFHDWVAKKLGYFASTAGWANMILAYSLKINPNEVEWEEVFARKITNEEHLDSIKLFYSLLDEYKAEVEGRDGL